VQVQVFPSIVPQPVIITLLNGKRTTLTFVVVRGMPGKHKVRSSRADEGMCWGEEGLQGSN